MSDVDVLERVLAKDVKLLAAVLPEQLRAPTPCAEYDVEALVNHIVGSLRVFAASAAGRAADWDPGSFHSTDPVADFQSAATELIAGWRAGGVDRTVPLIGTEFPAQMVLAMTLMEFVTHGCDLARATDQTAPFTDDELAMTLERAHATLPDQYRGEGKAFGNVIEVPQDAPVLDRLMGFMGRQP